jgi:hypothetical protein
MYEVMRLKFGSGLASGGSMNKNTGVPMEAYTFYNRSGTLKTLVRIQPPVQTNGKLA